MTTDQTTKPTQPARKTQLLPALAVAIVASLAGVWFATKSSSTVASIDSIQRQLENTLILPEDFKQVPEFSLLDKNGDTVTTDLLRDKWSLVFFGFLNCPDICPMTLTSVADSLEVVNETHPDLPTPQVLFVSVDPKRDRPDNLKPYVEYFNSEFNALTGELNEIHELTRPLNIVVSYTVDEEDSSQYTVDHTSAILLVDPELRVRAKFNSPHIPETVASDYSIVLKNLTNKSGLL